MKQKALLVSALLFAAICHCYGQENDTASAIRKELNRFYMSLGPIRAGDAGAAEKTSARFWFFVDDRARNSWSKFLRYLKTGKPGHFSIRKIETAGQLTKAKVTFSPTTTDDPPHPAEFTLFQTEQGWRLVNFESENLDLLSKVAPQTTKEDSARAHLDRYLALVTQLNNNPATMAVDADKLAAFWTANRTRDHNRQLGQSLVAFHLTQSTSWKVIPKKSQTGHAEFEVVAEPGNQPARFIPRVKQSYKLKKEDAGWRITHYSSTLLQIEK